MNTKLTILIIIGIIALFSFKFSGQKEIFSGLKEEYEKSLFDNHIKVYNLKKDGSDYGHTIWFSRKNKKIKTKYFASGTAYERYKEWKKDKKVAFFCSGAMASDSRKPVGYTVDNGEVVNRSLNTEKFDGLVIVYPREGGGGMVVSDLDKGNLTIKQDNKTLKVDPRNQVDKYRLTNWAKLRKATIFQTYLLAYKNELKVSTGQNKRRERRILALASNQKTKELFYIIFDVKKYVYLKDITDDILTYLKSKGFYTWSVLNLDTGMYDIMELYNKSGKQDYDVRGTKDSRIATNLLVYYYD